jgi:Tfp pilus assembly protein PilF
MKKNFLPFLLALSFSVAAYSGYAQDDQTGGIQFTAASGPATAVFQSALKYHDVGERKKALEAFRQAVAQDPKLAIAYMYLTDYSE